MSRTPVGVWLAGGPFGGALTTNPRDKSRGRAGERAIAAAAQCYQFPGWYVNTN